MSSRRRPRDQPPAHAPRAEAVRAALAEGDRDAFVALDLLSARATARALPRVLPPLRADLSMLLDAPPVEPRPLPVPITALGGRDDPLVSRAALLGWAAHTEADFALRLIPGGHLIHQDAPAAVLAAATGA